MRRTDPGAFICGIHRSEGKNLDQLVPAAPIKAARPPDGGSHRFCALFSSSAARNRSMSASPISCFKAGDSRVNFRTDSFSESADSRKARQFDNDRVRAKEGREVVLVIFVTEECSGRPGELDAFFIVHTFKTRDLLPTTRHPYPSPGTTLPFTLNVDRRCPRTSHPAARHPDVVCACPSPIPTCPDIF
jgi:hypothetical protein